MPAKTKVVKIGAYNARLRKGDTSATPKYMAAFEMLLSNPPKDGLRKSNKCMVVFFAGVRRAGRKGNRTWVKTGGLNAFQRCSDKSFSDQATERFASMQKRKVICFNKKGKLKAC